MQLLLCNAVVSLLFSSLAFGVVSLFNAVVSLSSNGLAFGVDTLFNAVGWSCNGLAFGVVPLFNAVISLFWHGADLDTRLIQGWLQLLQQFHSLVMSLN